MATATATPAHPAPSVPTVRPTVFDLLDSLADFGRWLHDQDVQPVATSQQKGADVQK